MSWDSNPVNILSITLFPGPQPALFIFYGPSACAFLTNWTNLTEVDLELQWPPWGTFELPKLVYLRSKLEGHGSKIKQTEWDIYFSWHLEASKLIQDFEIASQQNIISELTKVNTLLKEKKKASQASFSPPPYSLSLAPASSLLSAPPPPSCIPSTSSFYFSH